MKRFLIVLLALCMIFSLAACGSTASSSTAATSTSTATPPSSAAGDDITIGILIYKFDDTYIGTVRAAIEKYASDAGVSIDMQDGQGDQAKQNDQLDVLIEKKVDSLLINIVDNGAAQGVVDKAKAANIPFILFNREPAGETPEDIAKIVEGGLFVGTNAKDAGIMQGDLLADLWEKDGDTLDLNGDGKVQFLVFKGEPDNPEAIARTDYCISQSEERGLTMDNLNGEPVVANWNTDQAHDKMEALLAAYSGKIEVVFANNDDMALGVISALNAEGYNTGEEGGKWIPVIGVDATEAGLEAINAGKMYATVLQDGDAMGKAVVELAINAAKGAAAPFVEGTSYSLADDGYSVRIPYAPINPETAAAA